jgi:hypothetical protein
VELEELFVIDEPVEITDTGFGMPRIYVLIEERHKPEADAEQADELV